jgi:hypothetical protein
VPRQRAIDAERGQASPEWIGLVAVVALCLAILLGLLAPLPAGALLARTLGSKLICAVDLADSCRTVPQLAAAYGDDLAQELRKHTPAIFSEQGMRVLPVDYRSCRSAACADGPGAGTISRSRQGEPATAFLHIVDCRPGTTAPFAGRNSPEDCRGDRAGNLYLQYWLYYPESATLRGVPVAGSKGYHRDDWESYQVRIGPGGRVDARASSHHGYNYGGGAGSWGSDAGIDPLGAATDAVGLHQRGGWGPETGLIVISGGSHAGSVDSLPCCRLTPPGQLSLVPLEPLAAGEAPEPHFAIPPPWRKHVWVDPEAGDTG